MTQNTNSTSADVKHSFYARISEVENVSPTVRALTLHSSSPAHSAVKAGQWVDFYIPSDVSTQAETMLAGFSIKSSPADLQEQNKIELAVKYSGWPPVRWVHSDLCRAGVDIEVCVGGDCFYDPQPGDQPRSLLLIAGGIGINPILSILRHAADLYHGNATLPRISPPERVILLYSATCEEELVFKESVDSLCMKHSEISCQYYLTKQPSGSVLNATCHRITPSCISAALSSLGPNVTSYLCGPPGMLDEMPGQLISQGVSQENIHYEKWW